MNEIEKKITNIFLTKKNPTTNTIYYVNVYFFVLR